MTGKLSIRLRKHVNQLRNSLEEIFEKVADVCETLNPVREFKEKRKKKVKISRKLKTEAAYTLSLKK